jgi:U3 small nucleolar RNA-associated protein 11
MSSLRNAVKRITHKERAQPQSRRHLGLLEKKGDYQQRSSDYHVKSDRLKSMRSKVANRNPDEYYFGMHNSKVDGMSGQDTGRHVKNDAGRVKEMEKRGLGPDAIKIMKDQDLAYIRLRRIMDDRKIDKLQASLHYLENDIVDDKDGPSSSLGTSVKRQRKHTVFIDGGKEAVNNFNVAKHFNTLPELAGRAFNRPRVNTLLGGGRKVLEDVDDEYYNDDDEDNDVDDFDHDDDGKGGKKIQRRLLTEKQILKQARRQKKIDKSIAKSRSASYSEMELRRKRLEKLRVAEAHLIAEKQANMKGRKRKIESSRDGAGGSEGQEPAVYKWRRKRSK